MEWEHPEPNLSQSTPIRTIYRATIDENDMKTTRRFSTNKRYNQINYYEMNMKGKDSV